jgi:hypothetical protein
MDWVMILALIVLVLLGIEYYNDYQLDVRIAKAHEYLDGGPSTTPEMVELKKKILQEIFEKVEKGIGIGPSPHYAPGHTALPKNMKIPTNIIIEKSSVVSFGVLNDGSVVLVVNKRPYVLQFGPNIADTEINRKKIEDNAIVQFVPA